MFKGQYLVAGSNLINDVELNTDFLSKEVLNYTFFYDENLNFSYESSNTCHLVILGEIINPFSYGLSNQEVAKSLISKCSSKEEFFRSIQSFTGRFVIYVRINDEEFVCGDACHLRQIYYLQSNECSMFTSSPKLYSEMFPGKTIADETLSEINQLPIFVKKEHSVYGERSEIEGLKKLLPNHYLDLGKKQKCRIPFYIDQLPSAESGVLDYASELLTSTYDALHDRYHLLQPLTAGVDSRALLAASKKYSDKISYYIFDDPNSPSFDALIPKKLSIANGFTFRVIAPEPLTQEFTEHYRKLHVFPRLLPKTENIHYHYQQKYPVNAINVNGNGAEVARCFYGTTNKDVTLDMLFTFTGYGDQVPSFKAEIEAWFNEASNQVHNFSGSLLDLFYWEQRMGHWGALFPHELDIALEEISPFNNKSLLLALLNVGSKKRNAPKYELFERLVERMWPEVMNEPFNPNESKLKNYLKSTARGRYWVQKTISKLSKN